MKWLLISFSLFLPLVVHAESGGQSAALKFALDSVNASSADFEESFTLAGTYNYYFAPDWALDLTIAGINDSASETQYDNAGSYRLTLNCLDILLGTRYNMQLSEKWSLYTRGGLLWYQMDIELEEEFYGLKAGGSTSVDDSGFGFFVGGGWTFALTGNLDLVAEVQYANRRDVLGDSSRPFDVNTLGVLLGAGYKF